MLEDDEEIVPDSYEIDDLMEQLDSFPGGHLTLLHQPGGDVLDADAEAVAGGSVVAARGSSDSDRDMLFFDFGDQFIV